ncbi:Golgi integral membrane protein 4 isoform 2 [Rattus norvegicus]|uniref:Golgi integral membrane protein 4 n=1 Tax=Rattus norvegicus TaxID=10116 RepID=GOLI4_RAT|nr:Golgi integral membrane protein 4 isoform 2 [Rattus norvegicus]Q5BJK8.2 RecName: Full=Golgi integral membrane protein 4; AltName: Full=Golgi integral membrane protein, cis; Short=GIMPc; AltName: Full=Golgi phosphoprotein 4 [Rattus norvegicus]|eukprot:XP_006232562.1 PREDICTED: Golgi integral membrane protein 4 isoform X2 [Rattus norvegicus]
MGNGMCSRKQKRIFQTLLLLTVVFGFLYGAMLYLELQTQLRKAEAVALKYQQHQDSLSAQLQVVYEHRSRLEKSLQKERLEHKKAKEDFLVYKLEAQETLNKGRQDSNSRYSALNVQHQMLKSQHEELRKQHSDLEEEHRKQGEDFSRAFNDHKQRYLQLQQEKEQELSKLKETVYNLREENRQLRKAHQDIHTQLQDVKTQVAEYKQLKDTLNRIPSFRNPDPAEQQNVTFTHGTHPPQGYNVREKLTGELQEGQQNHDAMPRRMEEKPLSSMQKEAGFQALEEQNQVEPREPEGRQVEEEHRKALEEEEMEQVGQAEHLEEEHDPSPEEQDREWRDQRRQNAAHLLDGRPQAEIEHSTKAATNFRSPYEEQLEQQRLAARRDEEAQRLREHQEALHQQRLHGQLLRQQQQQQYLAREMAQQKQADHEEGQQQYQLRQQAHSDAVENDVAQGAEDQGIPEEEGGAYDRDNQRQDEAEGDPGNRQEFHEPGHQEGDPEAEADRAAAQDINPADDPNNQGEDEFEEAEQVREENLPEESEERKQSEAKQGNVEMDEHLVMAGNPDQQEDNVDEQYQEEGEEEVQEDLTEEKKRELEHNAEETYGENPDDKNNDVEEQGVPNRAHPKGRQEHYEEEEDEEDGAAVAEKSHRRAEM